LFGGLDLKDWRAMERPRILLVPQFTELEWAIAPQLAEWAEVATFDSPGVGDEPMPEGEISDLTREVIADRGLAEIDRRGWQTFFVVGDALGTATAVRLARRRRESVQGLALGHAGLSYDMEGDRPPLNAAVHDAMGQLLRNDYDSFVRYGITQMTQGTFDEDLAGQMVDRLPPMGVAIEVWETLFSEHEPIGEMLSELDVPLLLAMHDGCIAHTQEGFDDAVAAFPEAQTVTTARGPCSDPAFAQALRTFCEDVTGGRR
jgi:pimeloyl-ACP methyl ester carboxylesterase